MKNLKKLSVAIMLAALLSTSFTSCIDDNVNPAVEAIYTAQAELLMAQVGVLEADEAFRRAEAIVQESIAELNASLALMNEAQAGLTDAEALRLLERVEAARIANAEAQLDYEENQAELLIELAELANELAEVGALAAADYLREYKDYLQEAKDALKKRTEKAEELAEAIWWRDNGLSDGYQLAAYEGAVAVAKLQVDWINEEIAMYEAILADPNSMPAMVTAWEARYDELELEKEALKAQEVLLWAQIDELVDGADDDRQKFIDEYEGFQTDSTNAADYIDDRMGWIEDAQDALGSYDAAEEALKADIAAAELVIGALEDDTHPSGHAEASGLWADWQAIIDEIGTVVTTPFVKDAKTTGPNDGFKRDDVYNAPKAAPTTLYEDLWNAQLAEYIANDALLVHNWDFEELVITYNNAATALAAAQDITTETDALELAQDNLELAQDAWDDANDEYTDTKAIFEADPDGTSVTDGAKVSPFGTKVDDLGAEGIAGDANATTYREVLGWSKIVGENRWTPNSLGANLTEAQVLADINSKLAAIAINSDIPGGSGTDPDYLMTQRTDFYLWNQDGERATFDNTLSPTLSAFSGANWGATDSEVEYLVSFAGTSLQNDIYSIIYLEVEADDLSVSNLFEFNKATQALGVNDFSDRPFFTAGNGTTVPYTFNSALAVGDPDAGYDTGWVGNIAVLFFPNTLTAYAAVWNEQLEVFKKQNAFDIASTGLTAAQAVYDAQKLLFDEGLTTRATLEGAVSDAEDVVGKYTTSTPNSGAKGALEDAQDAAALIATMIGQSYISSGTPLVLPTGTQIVRPFATNLPFSADEHANDGLAAGSEKFDATNGSTSPWAYDSDGVKDAGDNGKHDTLTAYAILWNAEKALYDLGNCDDACLQADIDEWTHDIELKQPELDALTAVLADMKATYDMYMEVNIDGGDLDSDLAAQVIALEYELLQLKLEKDLVIAERDFVDQVLDDINDDTNLADVRWELEKMYGEGGCGWDTLCGALEDLQDAEEDLAEFSAEVTNWPLYIENREAAVAEWQARYDAAMALADKYYDLMMDALAG